MAADEAASAPEFLCDTRSCTRSTGGIRVEAGMSAGCFDLRKRGITRVGGRVNSIISHLTSRLIGNVTTAPRVVLGLTSPLALG